MHRILVLRTHLNTRKILKLRPSVQIEFEIDFTYFTLHSTVSERFNRDLSAEKNIDCSKLMYTKVHCLAL